jgi:hypothetical protein
VSADVRPRQVAAVDALRDLIARDLPIADWRISEFSRELDAQIHRSTAEETVADVAAWANFFCTKVEVDEDDDRTEHRVRAQHMGVPVEVWGFINRRFTYRKVRLDEQDGAS